MTESRSLYHKTLGVDPNMVPEEQTNKKLREAYDRAHDIRKFEIEMYWTRSTYLWAIQAAALAGLALAASEFETTSWSCPDGELSGDNNCFAGKFRLILIVAIWSFALFTAYVWLRLLSGSKFWQDNWERHVDLLEDQFSGALYKTYPTHPGKAPYSVSKLNLFMAKFTLIMWITIGFVSGMALFWGSDNVLLIIALFALLYPAEKVLDRRIRMESFPRRPWVKGTTGPWRREVRTYAYKSGGRGPAGSHQD